MTLQWELFEHHKNRARRHILRTQSRPRVLCKRGTEGTFEINVLNDSHFGCETANNFGRFKANFRPLRHAGVAAAATAISAATDRAAGSCNSRTQLMPVREITAIEAAITKVDATLSAREPDGRSDMILTWLSVAKQPTPRARPSWLGRHLRRNKSSPFVALSIYIFPSQCNSRLQPLEFFSLLSFAVRCGNLMQARTP